MALKINGTTVINDSLNIENVTNLNGNPVNNILLNSDIGVTVQAPATTLAGYGITDASTTTEMNSAISTAVSNLVDTAPATLDTLNELAAALGDDPNFATTTATNIGSKVSKSGDTMTGNLDVTGTVTATSFSGDASGLTGLPAGYTDSDVETYLTANGRGPGQPLQDGDILTYNSSNNGWTFIPTPFTTTSGGVFEMKANSQFRLGSGVNITGNGTSYAFGFRGFNFDGTYPNALQLYMNGGTSYFNNLEGSMFIGTTGQSNSSAALILQSRSVINFMTPEINQGYPATVGRFQGNNLLVAGSVQSYGVTNISDERLKKNIVKIDNALEKVQQLNGYDFEFIRTGDKASGVIAQEVEKVLPNAVSDQTLFVMDADGTETEEQFKSVQYNHLHGLLIEAIKEQQAQIDELKAKLNN